MDKRANHSHTGKRYIPPRFPLAAVPCDPPVEGVFGEREHPAGLERCLG